jgi:prepilin-type N-terminal cleavage/methylation domain-containing protein
MRITPNRHPERTYRLPADVQEEDLRRRAVLEAPYQDAGFSLVEISIVILVISIFAGFALLNIEGIMPGIEANAVLSQTVAQLRRGRELAIAERRNIEVRFLDNNQIQLVRFDVPNGRTVLSTVTLENGVEFLLFSGVPDTPDSFGRGDAVDFGGSNTLIFLSDGTLVDDAGNPVHGSVFLGLPDHPETARAVTMVGATGRVRGYRWTGSSWIQ